MYDLKKNKLPDNYYSLVGKTAKILSIGPEDTDSLISYQIRVGGEIWAAKSSKRFQVGESCTVEKQEEEEMTLIIS